MHAKRFAVLSTLLVVAAGFTSVATAGVATTQQADAYSETHVSFTTTNHAVVDYTVNDRTVIESLAVQSKRTTRNSGQVEAGVSLSAITNLTGATVALGSNTETSATVTTESDARMTAHDNGRGILAVRAGGTSQYVAANLSSDTEAEQTGERRVVITKDDGTQGAFIVVGDGQVTVNERGNVTAQLGENGRLVYRQYDGERTERDKQQEQLIADGVAAAEVYVQQSGGGGGETTTDVVSYGEETTVEVTETGEGTVEMTADRTEREGRVILCTVSRQTFESAEEIRVRVDGEAAARADSYSEVRQSARGGDTATFLVEESTSAGATADVVVGVNHFSTRTVTVTSDAATPTESGEDGSDSGRDGDDSGGNDTTDGGAPGFGAAVGIAAFVILGAVLFARSQL